MGDDGDSKRQRSAGQRQRLSLEVGSNGPAWTRLGKPPAVLARQVARALYRHLARAVPPATAMLMLSSDAEVRALNKQWRGVDKPTNVLSFPSAQPAPVQRAAAGSPKGSRRAPANIRASTIHLGDIIVAEETLVREARETGISEEDHFRHLVLHGLLHLLGYDHETEHEAEEMEALETRILATLGVADPYAGTDPVRPRSRRATVPRKGSSGR